MRWSGWKRQCSLGQIVLLTRWPRLIPISVCKQPAHKSSRFSSETREYRPWASVRLLIVESVATSMPDHLVNRRVVSLSRDRGAKHKEFSPQINGGPAPSAHLLKRSFLAAHTEPAPEPRYFVDTR